MEYSTETKEMKYEKATAEVVRFDNNDVVTASGGAAGGGSTVSCYINVF